MIASCRLPVEISEGAKFCSQTSLSIGQEGRHLKSDWLKLNIFFSFFPQCVILRGNGSQVSDERVSNIAYQVRNGN